VPGCSNLRKPLRGAADLHDAEDDRRRLANVSRGWSITWRLAYRLIRILDPLIRVLWRLRPGWLARLVELRVLGRRTGRPRRTLLTLLVVDGRMYVGHPNGQVAWTRNLEAAGEAELESADGSRGHVRAERLPRGPERERAIRATWTQQPFPANVLYAVAGDHIRDVGVYFRLTSEDPADGDAKYRSGAAAASSTRMSPP